MMFILSASNDCKIIYIEQNGRSFKVFFHIGEYYQDFKAPRQPHVIEIGPGISTFRV